MFQDRLKDIAASMDDRLARALAPFEGQVGAAMRHACRGGKRLRAFLVIESAALYGAHAGAAQDVAAAIEAMHAYSLVHDDLPAMDNDDMRRGQPTVHKKWDDATAILAGDALQSLAFELVAGAKLPDDRRLALISGLARSAGQAGMVLGQEMDIAAETASEPLSLDQITRLQGLKTGALFEWSAAAGPVMAGQDAAAMVEFARAFGLAFQIADDILDVEGDEARAGKRLRKDGAAGKATFVSLMGLEPARQKARDLCDAACDALSPYGTRAENLRDAARFVIARQS